MAIYSIEGKLGTGKTKFCIWRAQQALREGLRVASNVDIELDKLVPELPNAFYSRIPDKPTASDFNSIGHGNPDSYDEEKNGILILDELGSWLNTRSFQDKSRLPVIDWLIHARKHGWSVYFICQDASMIDSQVRVALIEYTATCRRLDKVKIPFFGSFLGLFNKRLAYMPRMHMVCARVGDANNPIVAERWNFRGDDLHSAYDTRQIFTDSLPADTIIDGVTHGYFSRCYSAISANYFTNPPKTLTWFQKLFVSTSPVPQLKPMHPLVKLCMSLPVDQRIRHIRRLTELGAIS